MTMPPAPEPPPLRVEDATCLECGLLCDDIALTVSGGQIIASENACGAGRSWFLAEHQYPDRPAATIDGAAAPLDEAIGRAASLLAAARSPLVTGLEGTTVEAQALAVALADRIGAAIDPGHSLVAWPRVGAVQRAGGVFASFGEVKNRADVIVLWDLDPWIGCDRFWGRLIDPPGRFVPGGRAGRTVLVADRGDSESRRRADSALLPPPGRHVEVFRALRAIVRGIAVDSARVERACGCSPDALRPWAERLREARYAAIAFSQWLAFEGPEAIEELLRLVDDLNRTTRCVALPLAGPGNPTGAEAVLTGRLGAPLAVDLSDGAPRFLPLDADCGRRLTFDEADAVLAFGGPGAWSLETSAPRIRIAPDATAVGGPGVVAIDCATPGIDSGGTVVRSDEVSLPLRPALDPVRPTDREVIAALIDRLRRL